MKIFVFLIMIILLSGCNQLVPNERLVSVKIICINSKFFGYETIFQTENGQRFSCPDIYGNINDEFKVDSWNKCRKY